MECGIMLDGCYSGVKENDVIKCFVVEEVAASLQELTAHAMRRRNLNRRCRLIRVRIVWNRSIWVNKGQPSLIVSGRRP